MVVLLLKHGARSDIPGWMQLTAFDRAQRNAKNTHDTRRKEIVALVMKHRRIY